MIGFFHDLQVNDFIYKNSGAITENMPRQFERIAISLQILLESSSGKREARISDLSVEGCFIDTILEVNAGEPVVFDVHLPTGQPVRLSGKVAYNMPRIGFGVRFDELSEENAQLLKQIILAHGGIIPMRHLNKLVCRQIEVQRNFTLA